LVSVFRSLELASTSVKNLPAGLLGMAPASQELESPAISVPRLPAVISDGVAAAFDVHLDASKRLHSRAL
jgi:hypothetical protein